MAIPTSAFFRAGEALSPSSVTGTSASVSDSPHQWLASAGGMSEQRWFPSTWLRGHPRCSWFMSFSSILDITVALPYLCTCSIARLRLFQCLSPSISLLAEMIPGNSVGCEGMITCDHNNLDPSTLVFGKYLRHSGPKGISPWQEPTNQKLEVGKVMTSVKWVGFWELDCWQEEVTETQNGAPPEPLTPCTWCGRP